VSEIAEMQDAIATQLVATLGGTANPAIENLQVDARLNPNPTPPSIDVYPGSPFTETISYGRNRQYWFNVRARVSTADNEAGQDLLLSMMDGTTDESIEAALASVKTYSGAQLGDIDGPTEFGLYRDTVGEESLLGCVWRVALIP
jgi:hypothetical protein